MKLAQLEVQAKNLFRHVWVPEQIFRQLWIGLLVFLTAILVRARLANSEGEIDEMILVLLVPLFLYCALSAHALARIVLIRREHPFGLEGSIAAQERSLLSVISGVGVVLGLLTVVGGFFFSSAFFNSVQPILQALGATYNWLTGALAQLIVWILMPLFGFFSAWVRRGAGRVGHAPPQSPALKDARHVVPPSSAPPGVELAVKILLPLLIFLVLALLLRLALRQRKRLRISLNRQSGDIHENIWSWQLFWTQCKAFWASLFRRLFPARATSEEQAQIAEEMITSPGARTIREIYRALLKRAAQRGHTRKRDETPYEFRRRLNEHEAPNEPQLGLLTDAYTLTRYGGSAPSEHELSIVRHLWNELEQKWEA